LTGLACRDWLDESRAMTLSKQVRPAKSRSSRNAAQTRREAGAAAVEFALVMPLLLLIVFGIFNFGILFSQQLTLNNGVREGDRRAVVYGQATPNTCNGIITSVQNELSGLAMDPKSVVVRVTQNGFSNNASACGASCVTTNFDAMGTGANRPCVGSYNTANNTGGSLIVEAQYVAAIAVPYPPFPQTLTLSSKAVFRCEFT